MVGKGLFSLTIFHHLALEEKMRALKLAIFAVCFWQIVFSEKVQYDNYRLYSVIIENDQQLNVLQELQVRPDGIIFETIPIRKGQIVDLIVAPQRIADISELFENYEFKNRLLIENLQKYDQFKPSFPFGNQRN